MKRYFAILLLVSGHMAVGMQQADRDNLITIFEAEYSSVLEDLRTPSVPAYIALIEECIESTLEESSDQVRTRYVEVIGLAGAGFQKPNASLESGYIYALNVLEKELKALRAYPDTLDNRFSQNIYFLENNTL